MSRTRFGTAGIALVALLSFPTVARASIIDVIWKMSGPQLVGAVLHCDVDPVSAPSPDYTRSECRVLDYRFTGALKERKERPWWLSLDLGAYTSTGRNSEDLDFKKFDDNMVAFEPMFEIRGYTTPSGNLMFHHGLAGFSYNVLFGPEFGTFDKAGLKFRPVGVTIHRSWNL